MVVIPLLITATGITVGVIAASATIKGLQYLIHWLDKK